MALPWLKRKSRLATLLKSKGDEDEDGLALDRILHGQSVIGKTLKTSEIEALRFQDGDLNVIGTLEYGQFGVIDVVNCCHDGRVYVRKSVEKRFASRNRECYPQHERDILLLAAKSDAHWAPRLLCAYQSPTHLNLVMEFAEGGNLWDLIESSPLEGRIAEADLRWWAPQLVSAIHWCHTQGFAHRDIKPHNFVLTPDSHVLLIDFGSAAPLLPPKPDGSQLVPKRYCLVPCGTCDYISPEILVAHEEALVALELECSDDDNSGRDSMAGSASSGEGYGLETDWWSFGAMLYEMAFGTAPFFVDDIRQTYLRIMDHKRSLKFDDPASVTVEFVDLIRGLLSDSDCRLGRMNVMEITEHPFFDGVDWQNLATKTPPLGLHLPKFTYTEQPQLPPSNGQLSAHSVENSRSSSYSQPFAFSALFQSSRGSPGVPLLGQPSPATPNGLGRVLTRSITRDDVASFIGFSWGPKADAFQRAQVSFAGLNSLSAAANTPRILKTRSDFLVSPDPLSVRSRNSLSSAAHPFSTPFRPGRPGVDSVANTPFLLKTPYVSTPYESRQGTVPRTGTVRRAVSDREAMKQLVSCIGMSARKKVLESGRKLKVLKGASFHSLGLDDTGGEGYGEVRKTLRFVSSPPSFQSWRPADGNAARKGRQLVIETGHGHGQNHSGSRSGSSTSGEETESTETELPPSPSPSPRPGSAMSFRSRRSGTPTVTMTMTGSYSQRTGGGDGTALLGLPSARRASVSSSSPRSNSASRFGPGDEAGERDEGGVFETQQNLPPLPALPQALTWSKLEATHGDLMKELESIEKRLRGVSGLIGRWN